MFKKITVYFLLVSILCPKSWAGGDRDTCWNFDKPGGKCDGGGADKGGGSHEHESGGGEHGHESGHETLGGDRGDFNRGNSENGSNAEVDRERQELDNTLKKNAEDLDKLRETQIKEKDALDQGLAIIKIRDSIISQAPQYFNESVSNELISKANQSSDLASYAFDMATNGFFESAQALSNIALIQVTAIKEYIKGVAGGVVQAAITATEAIAAIYDNPTLITNLSIEVMNLVSAGPGAVVDAVGKGFDRISDAVYQFEVTMASGTPEQQGRALGEFGGNVLLGIAGGETITGARAALGGIATTITEAGAAKALGTALNDNLRISETLAPKMTNIHTEVQGIVDAARSEGFRSVQFPRGAGAARGPVPEGYTRVSRWMSAEEATIWAEGGATRIPPGVGTEVGPGNIRLYVTRYGIPQPGGTNPVRVDFHVPESILQQGSRQGGEWPQIIQPVPNVPIYNLQINHP